MSLSYHDGIHGDNNDDWYMIIEPNIDISGDVSGTRVDFKPLYSSFYGRVVLKRRNRERESSLI